MARRKKAWIGMDKEQVERERLADAALPSSVGKVGARGRIPHGPIVAAIVKDASIRHGFKPRDPTGRRLGMWAQGAIHRSYDSPAEAALHVKRSVEQARAFVSEIRRLERRLDNAERLEEEIGAPIPAWACSASDSEDWTAWSQAATQAIRVRMEGSLRRWSAHERMELCLALEEPVDRAGLSQAGRTLSALNEEVGSFLGHQFGPDGLWRIDYGRPGKSRISWGMASKRFVALLLAVAQGAELSDASARAKGFAWMASIEAARRAQAKWEASTVSPAVLAALLGEDPEEVMRWVREGILPTAHLRGYKNHWGRWAKLPTIAPELALELILAKAAGKPVP